MMVAMFVDRMGRDLSCEKSGSLDSDILKYIKHSIFFGELFFSLGFKIIVGAKWDNVI